ncbi:rhodanese-like domain-containing protein [candidate division KSB1 bacterium]|nr:rhodanese-like domain-containing protein [candidate division KSB1 bacterium]
MMTQLNFSKILLILLFFLVLLFSTVVSQSETDWQFLSPEQLYQLMNESDKKLLVIDTLSPLEYRECSIINSINIPYEKLATTDKLPPDLETRLVFYCCSEICSISKKAAEIAINKGYKHVFVLNGGLPAWKMADYPTTMIKKVTRSYVLSLKPEKLKKYMEEKKDLLLVDIQPPDFFAKNHLPNSMNIPFADLEDRYHELPLNKTIIIIDNVGHRSFLAAKFLKMKGFKNVWRLFGGIKGWGQIYG